MGKVIYTITAAAATMFGQIYGDGAQTVTEIKTEKTTPVADTLSRSMKKEIRTVLVPNKKQLPS
ncbi:hypothetical protein [Flavobacterium sp.]|uniref:hypothetical protein n=1 Tax=Flavobacterium sp. TaxID=239 RepID=UPI0039E454EC